MTEKKIMTGLPGTEEELINAVLSDESIPKHYISGFLAGISAADIMIVGQRNGRPEFVLNMSFTTAKTLAQNLMETIQALEKQTGRDIMTISDVDKGKSTK